MPALYQTLDALAAATAGQPPPEWTARMVHSLPQAARVERVPWLLERCTGKAVVHFGASGPLHTQLAGVCRRLTGVDKDAVEDGVQCDLDWHLDDLPRFEAVDLFLLAEVIEHLVAPGYVLKLLAEEYPATPVIITTPNCLAPQPRVAQGNVVVNRDHNLWLCPQTLAVLLAKCGYRMVEFYYYGQPAPPRSEGMIAVGRAEGMP